ncbi:hypothetical protein FHW84_003444 [Dyella sp. SG562]|uniref:hypothetical protein n=1 Tax=Dyella sp. SG562 TaxID=2587017 RepID=UPI00141EAE88|nr:hypothetical protein [Dyella sp. SG562]NII74848.1 hypothetical protein [Dyella sp. SG562]
MSDVVFILGAGASRKCGAPLMYDFLDTARDLWAANKVSGKEEHFERVFRAIGGLQQVHSKARLDLTNLESIFTTFELGRVIQRIPGLGNVTEIEATIASLKTVIVETLETTMRYPLVGRKYHPPEPYESFVDLVVALRGKAHPRKSVSVVTFNYDVAADLALYYAGLGPNYVLDKPPHHNGDPVNLLKLHGSLNWATHVDEKGDKSVIPMHMAEYMSWTTTPMFTEEGSIRLPVGSQLAKLIIDQKKMLVGPEPLIVPPSWNKADYHHQLSQVWAAAAQELSGAESIYIIGYSLPETDSFFRNLYALGCVGQSMLRRIVVYNPEAVGGGVDARFRALLGPGAEARYSYEPRPFDDAIRHIQTNYV